MIFPDSCKMEVMGRGMMSQESVDKIVNDHFMYEATDDIEGVLGTFTEDVEHELVGGPDGPLKEKVCASSFL
jgi:hypothetical protein